MVLSTSVYLALLSMTGVGLSDFLYKRATMKGAKPPTFLALQAVLFNSTNLTFVALSDGLRLSLETAFYGAITASLVYSSLLLFLRSLSGGDISVNAPLFRINFVFTAVLGFFLLAEPMTVGKLLGLGLAVLAIFSFSELSRRKRITKKALAELISAMLLFGSFGYVYKLALLGGSTPIEIITYQGFFFISFAFINAWLRERLRFRRAEVFHAPLCGFLLSSSWLLLLYSISIGEVSISIPLMNLSFVLTSALGIIVWREGINLMKSVGLFASVLAVLAFSL